MGTLVLLMLFAVVVSLSWAIPRGVRLWQRFRARRSEEPKIEYAAKPSLMTAAERSFFGVLLHATGSEYHVFTKVRLADLVMPGPGLTRSEHQAALNGITGKHVDFVLADPDTLTNLLVIELDDGSHKTLEAGLKDSFKDAVLRSAGLRVLRIQARHAYSPTKLSDAIRRCLGRTMFARPRAGYFGEPAAVLRG